MIVLASDLVGYQILKFLVDGSYPIDVVVLHASDRGGFNGQIKQIAEDAGRDIELANADELDRPRFLDRLAAVQPRIGILAWWPSILKGQILGIPTTGWLNLHPSLLPHNRGKNPTFWCLADMTPCGVSLQFIDAGVDTGPIVAQSKVDVGWEDTGETIYLRCRERIVELFRQSIDGILSGHLLPVAQEPSLGSYHQASEMAPGSTLDLDAPTTARGVLNVIRAKMFAPHPTARFHDGGKTYSVEIVIREVAGDE